MGITRSRQTVGAMGPWFRKAPDCRVHLSLFPSFLFLLVQVGLEIPVDFPCSRGCTCAPSAFENLTQGPDIADSAYFRQTL